MSLLSCPDASSRLPLLLRAVAQTSTLDFPRQVPGVVPEQVVVALLAVEGELDLAEEDSLARLRAMVDLVVTTLTPTDRVPIQDLAPLPAATVALRDHMYPDPDRPRDDEVEEEKATMITMMTVDVVPVRTASESAVVSAVVAEDTARL